MAQPNSSQNTQQQSQPSQLPPEYRQALLEQQQRQQLQQTSSPTIQDIEQKYSQLPPQYRQALLEKQQREHQQQLLQQQQQGQQGKHQSPPPPQQQPQQLQQHPQQRQASRLEPSTNTTRTQSVSLSSSPSGGGEALSKTATNVWNSTRQRIVSAPLTGAYRRDRDNDSSSTTSSIAGPGRAHWKPDSSTNFCTWPGCRLEFGLFDRRHHCRKCGDIFCSTHCSKEVPLDQALDFNPAEGVICRTCVGCFEAYEQWQGLIPSGENDSSGVRSRGAHGSGTGFGTSALHTTSNTNESSSTSTTSQPPSRKPNIGRIPDGFLGGDLTGEAFGREDVVRQSSPASVNIAIKRQPPSAEQTVMPMPSVPHDWSWSTF